MIPNTAGDQLEPTVAHQGFRQLVANYGNSCQGSILLPVLEMYTRIILRMAKAESKKI